MNLLKPQRRKTLKTANIYDVAKRAGVSVFTVSAVINKSGQVSSLVTFRLKSPVQNSEARRRCVSC